MNQGHTTLCKPYLTTLRRGFFLAGILLAFPACNPHDVQVDMPVTAPAQKITNYTQSLSDLGLMAEIYSAGELKVQSEDIADNTGTSATSGGEIQRNITEIMKSTLNSIGGPVTFIEYNPAYIQNQMTTGYSQFNQKTIPDVVITGGITEFDRALETRGEGTDASAEFEVSGLPKGVPSPKVGFDYSDASKTGKARITLDFNMKDFKTLAGIPKMNTVNSMEVNKATREKEIGIILFGPTFGSKGSIKKVQGRHEAVRLLVEMSMMQMVGKYLVLPYWRLLGDDTVPDRVVEDKLSRSFARMSENDRITNVQEWLYLHGNDIDMTGVLDQKTSTALAKFNPAQTGSLDRETFIRIYLTIPINQETLARRSQLTRIASSGGQPPPPSQATMPTPTHTPPAAAPRPVETAAPARTQAAPPLPKTQTAAPTPTKTQVATPSPAPKSQSITPSPAANSGASSSRKIGRILTEDQW